jgi:hypothetical protein
VSSGRSEVCHAVDAHRIAVAAQVLGKGSATLSGIDGVNRSGTRMTAPVRPTMAAAVLISVPPNRIFIRAVSPRMLLERAVQHVNASTDACFSTTGGIPIAAYKYLRVSGFIDFLHAEALRVPSRPWRVGAPRLMRSLQVKGSSDR